MKSLFLACCLLLMAALTRAQPVHPKLRLLQSYYLLNDKALEKDMNFLVITDKKQFIKLFGLLNRPDTPDFSRELLIVLALPPTRQQAEVGFDTVLAKAGNFVEVYCIVRRHLFPLTYVDHPIIVAAMPRFPETDKINFYTKETMRLIASVEVKH